MQKPYNLYSITLVILRHVYNLVIGKELVNPLYFQGWYCRETTLWSMQLVQLCPMVQKRHTQYLPHIHAHPYIGDSLY